MIFTTTAETILVVEDRDSLRELLEVILCRSGYRVISAPDGICALRIIREEESIDLLLTDLEMPGMRGDVLATRFANLHPESGIIVTTSSTNAIVTEAAYEFLPKPFSVDELRDAVRRALQNRSMRNVAVG